MHSVAICFVCTGNICRSPTAEGVMRAIVERAGLSRHVLVDSAGIISYHEGELADPRARRAASVRGYSLSHRARMVRPEDFERFDYLLAMDATHLEALRRRAPVDARATIAMFRSFDPAAHDGSYVPDPYYGEDSGFDEVVEMSVLACEGLLAHVRKKHGLEP